MHEYQQQLRAAFQTTSIIGYCTSLSVIVYGLITYFLLSRTSIPEGGAGGAEFWVTVIGVMGAAVFLGMAGIRRLAMRVNRPTEMSAEAAIRQLQSTAVVVFGCCESISILGLVAALATKEIQNYYWMAFMSLLAFGTYFPKYERWEQHMQAALYPYLDGAGADG